MTTIQNGEEAAMQHIKQVRAELTDFFDKVSKVYSTDKVIDDVMLLRQYTTENMRKTLKEIGIFRISALNDVLAARDYTRYETYREWNLTLANGYSMLPNRYVFPIRDFAGQVSALVGWYPTDPKYAVIAPTGFVKEAQFFNAECYKTYIQRGEDTLYLVEGYFDALSLRAEGFCALSNLGLTLSAVKTEILRRFGKIVVITDADAAGRRVLPYLDGTPKVRSKQWHIQNPCTYVNISIDGIKDVDDLMKQYECKQEIYDMRKGGLLLRLTENGLM